MAIVLHPLVDLSTAWPPFFVENLRDVFTHGSGKSGSKFQALRNQMVKSLPSAPPPGPATFIVKCLEALVHVVPPHDEGLSHLLISALCQSDRSAWNNEDASMARRLAGSLFCDVLVGKVQMESRIVVKIPVVFGLELKDIGDILNLGQRDEAVQLKAAKEFVEHYILDLLKRRLYTGAVSLLKNFNLQTCDYQALIAAIVDDGQASLAVDWAAHLGREMLMFLVQHCTETGMYKVAYKVVQQHKLEADFPDAYHLYRQSSLRKLVGKGLWDVAQSIAEGDTQLIDYLVTLALEDNNAEKVVELCEQFHLDYVPSAPDSEVTSNGGSHYLQLESLMSEENIHWIDTHERLVFAERALFGVDVVGIDCEWKADTMRGVESNKVSILQVASSELVLVFDLISLLNNCQSSLDNFVRYLFHSPDILKLGYAVHNDLARLSRCFTEIEAFRVCESVLDLQKVFGRQIKGGLSGLAKGVLGSCLNKQSRMSDWETRPLSKKQLHYAALDAGVLLPIFYSIAHQPTLMPKAEDWKLHMTSFRVMPKCKRELDGFNVKSLEQASSHKTLINSHEDLVLATCELLGLPIPGLMKAELFHFTKAASLPPPIYMAASLAPLNETAFYGTVKVAGTTFSGGLAPSKKDAEFWAAQVALKKLNTGLYKVENCTKSAEKHARMLLVLQACSSESRIGCLRLRGDVNHIWKGSCLVSSCVQAFRFIR